jgi:hypothetical protein
MRQHSQAPGPDPLDDPRELSKWARIYAQNQSLPVVVFLVIFVALCAAIGGGSYLAAWAYLSGSMLLFAASLVLLVLAVAADIYLSIPRWGGKRMGQIAKRLYAKDGNVAVASPHTEGQRRLALVVVLGFGVCVVASVILGLLGYLPFKYMQPASALYIVPFLVILGILMRPAVGLAVLLWPALYALHALLIVAGAPILFTGRWEGLNMLIPVVGYGMLAGLVGHAYNRFALRKLKRLAHLDLPAAGGQGEVTGQ